MRSSSRCSPGNDQVRLIDPERCGSVLIGRRSVIDKETQYFIAEATRTLSLSDTGQCERVGDELWVGCATVPKEGRLCEVRIF